MLAPHRSNWPVSIPCMRTLTVVHQSTHRWFNGMGATPSPVLAESSHLTTHISWWSIRRVILLSLLIYFDSAKCKNVDFGPHLGIHEGILNTRNITIRIDSWIVKLQPCVPNLEGFAIFIHFPWSPIDWALWAFLLYHDPHESLYIRPLHKC